MSVAIMCSQQAEPAIKSGVGSSTLKIPQKTFKIIPLKWVSNLDAYSREPSAVNIGREVQVAGIWTSKMDL